MNDIQTIMKFESLPNEIIIECFEYLNACHIFHAFDKLNSRFNHLIRHISLCINFENVNRSIFDEFCVKMLQNPEIQNQVYSLHLPIEYDCFQPQIFLSFFSYEEFSNLQNFDSTLPLLPHQDISITRNSPELDAKMKQFALLFPKLHKLSILRLDWFIHNTHEVSTITNLTLTHCTLADFYWFLVYTPMLKYLHTMLLYPWGGTNDEFFYEISNSNVKQWIIDSFSGTIDYFEVFVKQTPNLKSLTISTDYNEDMLDAYKWEELITSSLPYLNVFKFCFSHAPHNNNYNTMIKLKQFQTEFWQKQHHWFTEYVIGEGSTSIYTIPYVLETYSLRSNDKRYCNNLKSNVNTFTNVTNLKLHEKMIIKNSEFSFPNVTSLTLTDPVSNHLTTEHIEYWKKIVNLYNLKHLGILNYIKSSINSSVLLEILKQAPQLFSLSIHWDQLILFLEDSDLCKYLNKRIKRLYISNNGSYSINDPFEAKQFCEIFSNIEHLECIQGHGEKLLFLLNHLPKLSTLNLEWEARDEPKENLSQFENEARKQNIIYDINIRRTSVVHYNFGEDSDDLDHLKDSYYVVIHMWFDKTML